MFTFNTKLTVLTSIHWIMTRLLFLITLLAVFACKNQNQETNNEQKQEATQPEITEALPINKHESIKIDPKFGGKLTKKETASIFTRRRENQLGISNKVYQGYSYKDDSGEYYILLTDHTHEITKEKDTLYDNIYGVSVRKADNQYKKRSTIKDEIDKEWETSIGFWNQYSEISDFDNDGIADLILVYGTTGQNDYLDGRTKIMVYYKKKRVSIKHQNSDISGGRITKINKNFYALPQQLQDAAKEKMKLMIKNGHAVFSKGWEEKMAKNATRLEE